MWAPVNVDSRLMWPFYQERNHFYITCTILLPILLRSLYHFRGKTLKNFVSTHIQASMKCIAETLLDEVLTKDWLLMKS